MCIYVWEQLTHLSNWIEKRSEDDLVELCSTYPMYWLLLDKWSNLMSFHRYKWQSAAKHILFSMCNMNILRIGGITDCY